MRYVLGFLLAAVVAAPAQAMTHHQAKVAAGRHFHHLIRTDTTREFRRFWIKGCGRLGPDDFQCHVRVHGVYRTTGPKGEHFTCEVDGVALVGRHGPDFAEIAADCS